MTLHIKSPINRLTCAGAKRKRERESRPGLMSHVSWTPSGAGPSSGGGYPSSGKSPRNCAALSDRCTGAGWLAALCTLSTHSSPTHGFARGFARILSGSLHSMPRQSRVPLAGCRSDVAAVAPPQSPSGHLAGGTPRARGWDSGAVLARCWLADACVAVGCTDELLLLLLRLLGGQCAPVHGLRSQCVPWQTSAAASTVIQDSTSNRGVADTMLVAACECPSVKQPSSVSLIQ